MLLLSESRLYPRFEEGGPHTLREPQGISLSLSSSTHKATNYLSCTQKSSGTCNNVTIPNTQKVDKKPEVNDRLNHRGAQPHAHKDTGTQQWTDAGNSHLHTESNEFQK